MRLATAGVLASSVVIALLGVGRVAVVQTEPGGAALATIATACILPLQIWLVLSASRGLCSARHRWALAAVAAVIIVLIPVIGTDWLAALYPLSALVLTVVPRPWSILMFAGLVAAPAPLTFALGHPEWSTYFTVGTLMFGTAVAVPVWLIAAIRQLEAARLTLADEAVIRERLRIDAELGHTLRMALETIAASGDRASAGAQSDPVQTECELRALVDGSRATLTETRRLVSRYQAVSLRTELQTAATLLAAAGIHTRLVLPPGDLPDSVGETQRRALRSEIVRLLRQDGVSRCVFTVIKHDGPVRIELHQDGADQKPTDVIAA